MAYGKNAQTPKSKVKSLHVLFTGLVTENMLSGGDQLFLDIAPRLPKDLKVIVVTPVFAKKHWKNIDLTNIEFRYLRRNRFDLRASPLLAFFSYLIRAWQTYWILRNEDVQSIYSCSDIAYGDIWPAFFTVGRDSNVKWLSRIYHVLLPPKNRQGVYVVNVIAFYLQRISFWMIKKRSSTIFALNPKLSNELKKLGFKKDKLAVLGAGIDFQSIQKFKPKKAYAYDVVALGRIAPVKGIFDAIKIWQKVHASNPSLQLAWIGGGQEHYQKKVNQLLADKNLTDSFHMLGFIEKTEVYSVLKSSKVFICTDHENGWGLAVCEAMASGLPVVAYDIEIFGSVYQKGYKSVPLFNTEKFAEEVINLLTKDKKREILAVEASEQARQFDQRAVTDTLINYLSLDANASVKDK